MSELKEKIKSIIQSAKLETKEEFGYGYHGSSKGDRIDYTLYWDAYRWEWTVDKTRALKGLVFKEFDSLIEEEIQEL